MLCPESLRVQAYFDGEVDAVSAAEIERHLERCAECRELRQGLERTRDALRRDLPYHTVPHALAGRVRATLDQAGARASAERGWPRALWAGALRLRPFWAGALSGVGVSAVAAALALFVLVPLRASPLVEDLLAAHLRSLMASHLIDVASSDRHTVKPWFAGHADVSPAVADFDAQGYRLIGGRADYLNRQRSAVLVYQHGAHVINVFSWAADRWPVPASVTRDGYHLLFWRAGDLDYCAVSDAAWEELHGLARLLQERSAHEALQ